MKIEEMIASSNKLGEVVTKLARDLDAEYAKPLIGKDGLNLATASERGANIAKITNELEKAVLWWRIETKQWRNSEEVKKVVQEYNAQHPEPPLTFDGDRRCINEHPGCRICHKENPTTTTDK